MKNFEVLSEPRKIYKRMLEDIKSAKKSVYLETYIYNNDKIGRKFKKEIMKKASEGVKIMLLIDSWGSHVDKKYFSKLIKLGAEVKFFREIQYVIRMLTKNHERNHRKLLLIDSEISYIGSINITNSCINWRELVLRLDGEISYALEKSFMKNWEASGNFNKKKVKNIIHKGFEIINDFPSEIKRITEKKYTELIKTARKRIMIETPYFVPSGKIRKAFYKAVKRGVKIDIIVPYISDMRIADLVRNRYFEILNKNGINIHYYTPRMIHSKLLIIDDRFFILGSSNLDYRSFMHQYEINLLGRDKKIIKSLTEYFKKDLSECKPFNYEEWKKRASTGKIIEIILSVFRRYM